MAKKASGTRVSGSIPRRSCSVERSQRGFGGSFMPSVVKGTPTTLLDEGDAKLLSLVSAFKRMRIDQAAAFLGSPVEKVKEQVRRLKKGGWVSYTLILAKDAGLWTVWPEPKGLEVVGLKGELGRGLPALANLSHDYNLVEIALAMVAEDPNGEFIPERLVGDAFGYGRDLAPGGELTETGERRRSHRPDGVFIRGNGKKVLVECETSTKTKDLREWMMRQNEGYVNPLGEVRALPEGNASEEGRVLPLDDEHDTVAYFGVSESCRSPLQLTVETWNLYGAEIFEVPKVLWPAGSHIND